MSISMRGIYQASPTSWQMFSAVAGKLWVQSGLSTLRWRGHFFVRGAILQSTCLRPASTRSCPCIARLSRIPRPSSRMRFAILGTTWICTRSLCSGRSGDRPHPAVIACCDDSGRASLARGVVRRLAASTDPTTPGSALLGQAASATPLQSVPSRRPRAEPSRVATLKRHYRKSGFSGRAARVLSGVVRESSSRLYQSRWRFFCGWCRGRGVAPVNATVPVVVDSLIHLRQDKGLSVSAVKGYCSALNSVLALKGRDLAASREITTLLRSFARSVNPVELRPPAWDISLVLQSLTGAPYEPLRTCEERFLAQKMLFLLALASAKRIGELHALSYRVSHTRGWGEVSFAFVTGFVAKTQDPSSLAPRFEGFTVPALPNARKNRNGRLLCPVRAVKVLPRPHCFTLSAR